MSHSAKACWTFSAGRPKEALKKQWLASTSNTVSGLHCVEHSHFPHFLSDSSWAHPVGTCLCLHLWAPATTHFPSPFTGIRNPLHAGRLPHKSKALGTYSGNLSQNQICFKLDGLGMLDTVQQQLFLLFQQQLFLLLM